MAIERVRKLWDIETLKGKVERGNIEIPEFQRGNVWSLKKKSEAVYSLLTIGLPDLILLDSGKGNYQILDGLQRLNAIIGFLNNEYRLKFDEKLNHTDRELYETLSGKLFKELPETFQSALLNAEIGAVIYSGVEDFEVAKEIFTRLNYRPTPLSRPELLYVLTFDREKSPLLKELGERLSKRRMKGFSLVARFLANYTLLEEGLKEENFKFSQYYDWLYKWLKRAFEKYDTALVQTLGELLLEFIGLLKEIGIDAVKAPYWIEFLTYLIREFQKSGLTIEEFFETAGREYLKAVQRNPDWIRNVAQKNRQKPKELFERFQILKEVFKKEQLKVLQGNP